MIRSIFAALALLLATAPFWPATAQTEQERLQARYDRALAAGYKALMLCGAIASTETTAHRREPDSVLQWELAGIQPPHDAIVADLPHVIDYGADGMLDSVSVAWADDMPPRIAANRAGAGCAILPIGAATPAEVLREGAFEASRAARSVSPIDEGPMAALARTGFDARYGDKARTTSVLVQRAGKILGEAFAPGFGPETTQRTFSVAKSIAATMIGAAVLRGEVQVNASAGLGESADDPRRAITIDQALRMASGRFSDTVGARTDPLYYGGSSVEETATGWPLVHAPGTVFRYANNDTLAAIRAIKPALAAHPPAALFAKLGMTQTFAETDWRGDYVLSSQVWATPRDLAKLGQLYLQKGRWNGEQVIPADWLAYVSSPSGPQPAGEQGYGAGFWLLNKSAGIPGDTIAMNGNRGQYVVIVPSRDMVIVRRGEDPPGARFDLIGFVRDVLAGAAS